MAQVKIYTTSYCPYCVRAKALLKRKGVEFEEIDVTDDRDERARMVELAGGRRTVPQIFVDGAPLGGYDELARLDKAGKLDLMLAGA
jgi:glutaredoxin 3